MNTQSPNCLNGDSIVGCGTEHRGRGIAYDDLATLGADGAKAGQTVESGVGVSEVAVRGRGRLEQPRIAYRDGDPGRRRDDEGCYFEHLGRPVLVHRDTPASLPRPGATGCGSRRGTHAAIGIVLSA